MVKMTRIVLWLVLIVLGGIPAFGKNVKDKFFKSYSMNRAVELIQGENPIEAKAYLENEIAENPKNGYAYELYALLLTEYKDYSGALNAIERAIKLIPSKDKETLAYAFVLRGKIYYEMDESEKALIDYSSALKLFPSDIDALIDRAALYAEREDYSLSDADYRRIMELEPGNATGYFGLANNAMATGHYEEALSLFDYSLKLDPSLVHAYASKTLIELKLGRFADATGNLWKVLISDNPSLGVNIIKDLPEGAIPLLRAKLKVEEKKDPDEVFFLYLLGLVEDQAGDKFAAIDYYKQAVEKHPDEEFYLKLAEDYYELNDYSKALSYAKKGLAMAPTYSDLYDVYAASLTGLNRLKESLEARNDQVTQNPDAPFPYYRRGTLNMRLGNYKQAIEDYETAGALSPLFHSFSTFSLKLADAYRLMGDDEKSDELYFRAFSQATDTTFIPTYSLVPLIYAGMEMCEDATELAAKFLEENIDDATDYLMIMAQVFAICGDNDRALSFLDMAVEEGYSDLASLYLSYYFKPLENEPEFLDIIEKVKQNIPSAVLDNPEDEEAETVDSPDNEGDDEEARTVVIPFSHDRGVTKVECTINGLPLYFIFDTGAADVTLSLIEAQFMMKHGYLSESDIIGRDYYSDANGDVSVGTVVNLRHVDFGGLELKNVRASIVGNQKAPLLLGQSVLSRLGKIEIDNELREIIIRR